MRQTVLLAAFALLPSLAAAQRSPAAQARVEPLAPRAERPASELVDVVRQYTTDRGALMRRYDSEGSPVRRARMREFYTQWRARLREVDFNRLGLEGRIDYVLLDAKLRMELADLGREDSIAAQVASLAPFLPELASLQEGRRRLDSLDAPAAARLLTAIARRTDSLRTRLERAQRDSNGVSMVTLAGAPAGVAGSRATQIVGLRTVEQLAAARTGLRRWYEHFAGYDPMFTWWVAVPYRQADSALARYHRVVRERAVGAKEGDDEPIVGYPIGAAALQDALALEFIAYTPQELLTIAEREFAWCEQELRRAARDMGFGDDWRTALEKVKETYVEPGRQPMLVRELANEAIQFVESRNLVTVPALAKEVWRMEMLSPAAQRVSPFFLGGEVVQVAYPTDAMAQEDKLMTMRGNNPHFSRAVVHHELIPGHHLQQFMSQRYNSHRLAFGTPFWNEGNSLYWEMRLWELGFPKTPEDRIGMLFWRSHRAARIIFSLRFHMGTMSPQEAIDFLVERVGHERANATAEVRRSFNGTYPPLYQLAYMIGGLQYRALHRELVTNGRMSERQFHDAILQGGTMPVDLVRARLSGRAPSSRDYRATWRFAE